MCSCFVVFLALAMHILILKLSYYADAMLDALLAYYA